MRIEVSEWACSRMNGPAFCCYCGFRIRHSDDITPYCPYCGRFMVNYKEHKCSGYIHSYYDGKPHCLGTKEIEECSCDGDMRKCDFYEELKIRSRKNEN